MYPILYRVAISDSNSPLDFYPICGAFPDPGGLHPADLKEGFHRIMKVAASPRPRILEPRLRLPVRPFSPAYARPVMASADFCEPLKIPYGILSRHRQDRRPPRVRTAAFPPHPPHLLHHLLMVMGFALSRKLALMIQPDMRFVFLRSAFCLRWIRYNKSYQSKSERRLGRESDGKYGGIVGNLYTFIFYSQQMIVDFSYPNGISGRTALPS